MLLRGMPSASAVVCARREANFNSIVVALSLTIASVPLAWGLGWALKWMSITKSSTFFRQRLKDLRFNGRWSTDFTPSELFFSPTDNTD